MTILFPLILAVAFGAIVVPIALLLDLRLERRRVARAAERATSDVDRLRRASAAVLRLEAAQRFGLAHLVGWKPIYLLVSPLGLLWVRQPWGPDAIVILVNTLVASLWYADLKRNGVRHAEVFAPALWMLPLLVVSARIVFFAEITDQWPPYFGVDHDELIQKMDARIVTLAIALVALPAAVVAAMRTQRTGLPLAIAGLAFAHVFYFAWASAFGVAFGAFAMVAIGHALARESRANERAVDALRGAPEGAATLERLSGETAGAARAVDWMQRLGIAFVGVAALASVVYVAAWFAGDGNTIADRDWAGVPLLTETSIGLTDLESAGVPLVSGLALGMLAAGTMWWLYRRGDLAGYGAILASLVWVGANDWLYGPANTVLWTEDWGTDWGTGTLIGMYAFGGALLLVMWQAFGPDSAVVQRLSRGRVEGSGTESTMSESARVPAEQPAPAGQ